jgi:hypothetical protein
VRKRTLWITLGALAGLWLVPAAFVSLFDPRVPRAPGPAETPGLVESALLPSEPKFFLFSHGYTKGWEVITWEGEDEATADKTIESFQVARGPLDRRAGTFKFTVWSSRNHASDVEAVQLFVTSVRDWDAGDDTIWTQVAHVPVKEPGADVVALLCEAVVPASTTAFRFQEVRGGAPCCGFSQTMLTAPTFLGRVYDTIAWHPLLRWVPALR